MATLTYMAKIDYWNIVQPINIEVGNSLAHYCSVKSEVDENSWCNDIKQFIQHRKLAMNYYIDAEVLYKRLFDGTLLKCLDGTEAKKKCSGKFTKRFVQLMLVDIWQLGKYKGRGIFDDHRKRLHRICYKMPQISSV